MVFLLHVLVLLLLLLHLNGKKIQTTSTPNPSNKGFGKGGTTLPAKSGSLSLEQTIQDKISTVTGLREAMNLEREIESFDLATQGLSGIERTLRISEGVENTMKLKTERLQLLQEEGMTKERIHHLLQEITWDSSASIRDERHTQAQQKGKKKKGSVNLVISDAVTAHMLRVAQTCTEKGSVLDVGCGTGILVNYLLQQKKEQDSAKWQPDYIGIDLSKEMVKAASANHPKCMFQHADFLGYSSTQQFSTIVFNECLHYLLDIPEAISHAASMLSPDGRIVISHPKGYDNVSLQRSKNRLLVASLLPTADEWHAMNLPNTMKIHVTEAPVISTDPYFCVLEITKG